MNRLAGNLRGERVLAALLVLGGIAAGAVWREALPFMLRHSDQQEGFIAVDGTLALIGVVAGLFTGLFVVVRPGPSPAARTVVAMAGSIAGSLLALLTGFLLNAPFVSAFGIVLAWPFITAFVIFAGAVLPITPGRISGA